MIAASATDFRSWRATARRLLAASVSPDEVVWDAESGLLFSDPLPKSRRLQAAVPREFLKTAQTAALHRGPGRWALLYKVLYRITHGEHDLIKIEADDDIRQLRLLEKEVRRDMHKMKAFVCFRRISDSDPEQFAAWHKPDHYIVEAMAPWFAERFASLRWSILTPDRSAHWDGEKITYAPGVPRSEAPGDDALEDLWRDYYRSIFNPARVKVKAMKAEMPVRHWATLPEAQIIPELLANADTRVMDMTTNQKASAAPWVPAAHKLPLLQVAAPECRGCDLYRHATQVVFGEGPADAKVVMVGEVPGDEEDLKGHPFVGPAGRLLDKAMREAGLDRERIYVTNAVKHFKFTARGKRRIHAKPGGMEISACRPWLEAELDAIKPELIVCLGATAAQSLMGRDFRITASRAQFFPHRWAKELVATVHPSAILRMPDTFDEEYAKFVHDLEIIAARVERL
jgi:uracil-DNA glycosylase